jgi:hypothetical protein
MPKPTDAPPPPHIVTDFVLEGTGDRTLLHVVASGFDPGAQWDAFFDGVRRGWRFELGSLKHYLQWHSGRNRTVAWAFAPVSLSLNHGWRAALGPGGWHASSELEMLSAGDPYTLTAPDGSRLSGTVTIIDPPTDFTGTVDEFNNGLLRIQLEPAFIGVWLATYGVDTARLAALERRWQSALERLATSGR